MTEVPVAQQRALLAELAKPTPAYKRRAWFAMIGLALFVTLYLALAAWFLATAWRFATGPLAAGKEPFIGYLMAGCSAFLGVFMLKAIFFVKRGSTGDNLEISAAEQPALFEFLYQLADAAGAPRPHRVFLSPQVNAAVFYDLSLLNLIFPSRKNLEIGLGLVNTVNLGELRAVLAHEFGHFAQRAMAVGRWTYIGQQIAGHLVARRDKLDGFLAGLSRWDVRIAWIGWVLRLIVWSIRSLVDSAFQLVMLMQRALSREMEMNADLVAVSLTGSDALINALHRLRAADDAWERALGFAAGEKAQGRPVRDVFELQSRLIALMGRLLNDADYGSVPPPGATAPEAHRLFKAELAQPPRMWLTHPLNHEREANAKRRYVSAEIDERSAWSVFTDATALRETVTARLFDTHGAEPATSQASLQALDAQFEREYLKGRYRGAYFGRSIVRCSADAASLHEPAPLPTRQDLAALYPPTLEADIALLRQLEKEHTQLAALKSGALRPPNGVIEHRGRRLERSRLAEAIESVDRELATLRATLRTHDRQCRSLHLAVARHFGNGWSAYLEGLLAALHYADHTEDDLRDLQGVLRNAVSVETATQKVGKRGVARIVAAGGQLHAALAAVHAHADEVRLDTSLLARLGIERWAEAMGPLQLGGVDAKNVGPWLNAVDSWVDQAAGLCGALRNHALEQLLVCEAALAEHLAQGTEPPAAPAASRLPARYATLLDGAERKRQTRLGWWARFQVADGLLPAGARLLVAGGIVGAVLGLGAFVNLGSVTIYNGLARPVRVKLGDKAPQQIPAFGSARQDIDDSGPVAVETHTLDGALIERFDGEPHGAGGEHRVYNVAGAAPLLEWSAVYGNFVGGPDRRQGAPRWTASTADVLFTDPPKSIKGKKNDQGGVLSVLSGAGDRPPSQQLSLIDSDAERMRLALVRARWDALDAPYTAYWLAYAQRAPGFGAVFAARQAEAPDNVVLLRLEQDGVSGSEHAAVCARDQARAAGAPANADLHYIAARCLGDLAARDQAMLDGLARHPQHGWYAFSAGHVEAERAHWPQAIDDYELARRAVPALAGTVAVELARIQRLLGQASEATMERLGESSEEVRYLVAMESGRGLSKPEEVPYPALAQGRLERALTIAKAFETGEAQARVLRLVAASDGASPAQVAQGLALAPTQGLDDSTVWAGLGLAARAGRDLAAFTPMAQHAAPQQAGQLLRFAEALRARRRPDEAERLIAGLTPQFRGQAYSMGAIVLGARAPQAWRDGAKRLLFASERPYFE